MHDQHLAIGRRTGANPDHRDLHRLGDLFGQHAGHALQQQHGGAGLLQGDGIGAQLARLGFLAALDLEAAEQVDRLRGQAEMRADRHAHLCQAGDRLRQPGPTLQLDHVCAGLHQADRVGKGLGHGMAGFEGQVGDDQGTFVTAFHAGRVIGHFLVADRQGAVVTLQYHSERISDQKHVHAGLAGGVGEGGVVAGQHGDLLAALLQPLQGGQGYIRHGKAPRWAGDEPARGKRPLIVRMGWLEVNCRCYRIVTALLPLPNAAPPAVARAVYAHPRRPSSAFR
ncbi:Uncharacterised protein [Pseudomonas aeruginosa]|nr:Uncharacterised protein [Pseudomonas aeruginosa]